MNYAYTDDDTLEEFLRRLSRANEYKSSDLGHADSIQVYWKEEAIQWVRKLYKVEDSND